MQNINSKLDSMKARLAKLEDRVKKQQKSSFDKIFKADIEKVSKLKQKVKNLGNEIKFK